MMNSQLIAPAAATTAVTAAFVQGSGRAGVDLTLVLPLHGSAATLRYLVERMCEALYAQCISFEMVAAYSDADTTAQDLDGLPLTRFVQADQSDRNASLRAGHSVGSGRWVGFLDVAEGAEVDAYRIIELLHQAREGVAA